MCSGRAIVDKRLAIQQTILGRAKRLIDQSPENLEGLQRVGIIVANTEKAIINTNQLNEVRDYARARRQVIADALLESGIARLDTFPTTLEGLGVVRDNVNSLAGQDMRTAYIDAASRRNDAISAVLAQQKAEQREKAIAAGGDPDITGYTFVDDSDTSMLGFRDENRVIFAVLGMKIAADYEVSQDDVIIEGPNGTLIFTKHEGRLTGTGLTFRKQQN